jgi:hypothetical protein
MYDFEEKEILMKTLTLFLFAALALVPAAKADHGHHKACADDVAKLCGTVDKSDHEAIHKCLEDNKDKLSPACAEVRTKMEKMKKEWEAACGDDMTKLCGDVDKSDHKAMHECMDKNEKKISKKCAKERKKMKKEWEAHKKDAEREMKKDEGK